MLNMPLMVVTLTGMGKGKWRQGLFINFLRTQHIKTLIVIFKNSVTTVDENVHSHRDWQQLWLSSLRAGGLGVNGRAKSMVLNLWAMILLGVK